MKKILSFVLVCAMMLGMFSFVTFAEDKSGTFEGTGVSWSLVDGVMTISGTGAMPDYRGVESTRPWIEDLNSITKVVVKSGVTHLGSSSFTQAKGITEVVLEEGLTTIGQDAFSYCGTINKVTLPTTLYSLGQGVFFSSSITEISSERTKADFLSNVSMGAYNDAIADADWGEAVVTSGTLTETMTWEFVDGVLTIAGTGEMPNFASSGLQPWVSIRGDIKKIVVAKGVTKIGANAFANSAAEEIIIPEGVTSIGGDAFAYISALKTIYLPSTLTSIGQGTVYASNNIKNVYYYGESKEAFLEISSKASYNDNYTKSGVTFTVLETEYEIQVIPYGNGFETWSGQTQILVCPKFADGTKIEALYSKDVVWTFTLTDINGTSKTVTLKQSSNYNGGTWGIIRFQPCVEAESNRFIPLLNNVYTIEVSAVVGNTTYHGVSATGAFKMTVAPVVNDVADNSYVLTDVALNVYPAFGGWENWGGSPNKGTAASVTQLLVGANAKNGATLPALFTTDATWTVTFTWLENKVVKTKTIQINPTTYVEGYNLLRFETVLATGDNQFIPEKAQAYTVAISTVINGVTYSGTSAQYAFSVPMYPMVNGVEDTDYEYVEIPDSFEAMVGKYYFATVEEAIEYAQSAAVVGKLDTDDVTAVLVFAEGTFTVTTDTIVAVVAVGENTVINYANDVRELATATVEVEGESYTAYVIANKSYAVAVVGEDVYTTIESAIEAAEGATVDAVKNNPVVILAEGSVVINTTKAVVVVPYDSAATTLVFDTAKYFTYEVEVEYEGDTYTAYAVLNAVDFCQAMVDGTMYADLADAIAAAKGTFTPVIVFKPGVVTVDVDSFVILAAATNETVINKAGYLSYETEVEYEGDTYTAYAIYNHNYIFTNVANQITASIPDATATYTASGLNIALTTTDLSVLVGTDVFEAIMADLAPLFVLSDTASVAGVTVYENSQILASKIFKVFNATGISLETIANATSKTLTTIDVVINSAGTTVTVPVSITLDIADDKFETLKTNAAKALQYVNYTISDSGEIVLTVDARPVVALIMEKELAKGKTIKEVRDFINSTSIRELAEKLEGYGFTGAKAQAVATFTRLVNKLAATKYAANLDSTIAMFDTDKDGVYVVDKTFVVSFGEKINEIVDELKANNPDIADYITIENIVDVDSLTISVDATVTVFDTYTVTFVDVNGNVIYSETLLEGEIPTFTGVAPEKDSTSEFTYVFIGWNDGTTTFEGDLAELTGNVTYAPVFEEVALNGLDENLKFEFGSVTFQDSFKINMVANKSAFEGYTSWWVVATLVDGTEEVLEAVENGSYYKFVLDSVSAKEVADVVSFVIYAEKEVNGEVVTAYGNAQEYCIKQYAMNKICCENASDELKTLCVDTLIYAAHAQIKFGYNTANLATKDLTADQFALGTQGDPVLENAYSYENTESELVKFQQATLVYESNIAIKFYLNLKTYTPDGVYVKVTYNDGADELVIAGEDLVENGIYYTFEFAEYSAANLRKEVVVAIYDAATDAMISGPLTYGAEVYAYRQIEAGRDVDLVKAMMNYAISAEAVFNA